METTDLNVSETTKHDGADKPQDRFILLDGGHIALVQDTSTGEIVGAQLMFGGVINNRHAAMHTLDMLEGNMRVTAWRIDQVVRMPAEVVGEQSVQ